MPHISTKFLTIKNLEVVRWIPLISCSLYLFAVAATWIGMAYRVQAEAGVVRPADEPDAVLPTPMMDGFGSFVVGIVIAARRPRLAAPGSATRRARGSCPPT